MRNVVIASAARTAIGKFGGSLKNESVVELGAIVVKEALKRASVKPEQVEEIVFGHVLQAGHGQNPARRIGLEAGIPQEVPGFTVNKLCGSGLRAITLGTQMIKAGDADIIVAGGVEIMSASAYGILDARWGERMGHSKFYDLMLKDGLIDSTLNYHMGVTAENIAERWGISREEQDEFAVRSQTLAEKAIKSGRFKDEIVPVTIKTRKGEVIFDTDEDPRVGTTTETLAKLRPAFKKDGGTVTAGNSSGINDGAAAVVIMSEDKAKELGIKPLARVVSYGSKGVDPSIMGYGPVGATKVALERANLEVKDLDLIEANEAFASQSIAVARDLGFDMDKVNVNGGAIALGHPVGCSGARILTTLLYEMQRRDVKRGLATLCIGGGQGAAIIVERM